MNCRTCKWFDPLGDEPSANGLCRINPPTVVAIPDRKRSGDDEYRAHSAWPYVRPTDRCGQHEQTDVRVRN